MVLSLENHVEKRSFSSGYRDTPFSGCHVDPLLKKEVFTMGPSLKKNTKKGGILRGKPDFAKFTN